MAGCNSMKWRFLRATRLVGIADLCCLIAPLSAVAAPRRPGAERAAVDPGEALALEARQAFLAKDFVNAAKLFMKA